MGFKVFLALKVTGLPFDWLEPVTWCCITRKRGGESSMGQDLVAINAVLSI